MPRSTRFSIGAFFLSKKSNSPNWCASWFDKRTGQTKRQSLKTADFETAKKRLAEYAVLNEHLHKAPAHSVRLLDPMFRYYEQYGKHLASGEAISFHIEKWADFSITTR